MHSIAPVFIYSYITKNKFYVVLVFRESTKRRGHLYSTVVKFAKGG